ncbi:MAG: DEAD/DEAH box helicase [Proteobacteria bacterium]|nr:DEAD/DEAH box helicase [Pseudomonadota bacterium]
MNTVSTWKDCLVLNWDGQLPPGADPRSVIFPSDVVHHWKHLKGYARHSKRACAFLLNISVQNLRRLQQQFPNVAIPQTPEIARLLKRQEEINDMVERSLKIKQLPIERLPTYNYKLPPLAEYQHRAVVFLKNIKRAALFADCGMGKTYIVLTSTEQHIKDGIIQRGKTLICAKLATLESGWMEDAQKFTDLKVVTLWEPSGKKRTEKILDKLNSDADVFLINHDGLRVFKDYLKEKNFEKIVVDESTILKGFHGLNQHIKGGQFGRALLEVAHNADWRVIMSGTPAPNGPHNLWGQFYFLDPDGIFLEPTYNDFQSSYMQVVDMRPKELRNRPMTYKTPKKWVPKSDAIEKVSSIINPASFRARLRDHLQDMPELTTIRRMLDMDSEQKKHYLDMKERLRVVIDDQRITAPVRVAQIMKLRQITSGFIIDHLEEAHPLPNNPKLTELDSLIEDEIGIDKKVVIYAQYQWEIRLIEDRYKHHNAVSVYGGNTSKRNMENINSFIKDNSVRIAILHPKSAAHGITFTMAHYMVFFSIDHSAEDNYQSIKRIERAGQKNPMFVYYLLCKNSIDTAIYEVLQLKNRNQQKLIDPDQLLLDMWGKQ